MRWNGEVSFGKLSADLKLRCDVGKPVPLDNAWRIDEPAGRVRAYRDYIAKRQSYGDFAYGALKQALGKLEQSHDPELEARFAVHFRRTVQTNGANWDGHAWEALEQAVYATMSRLSSENRAASFRLQVFTPKMERLAINSGALIGRIRNPNRDNDPKECFFLASHTLLVLASMVREVTVHSFYDGGRRPDRMTSDEWQRQRERLMIATSPELRAWTDLEWAKRWIPNFVPFGVLRHAIAHGGTVVHGDRIEVFDDNSPDVALATLRWEQVANYIEAASGAWVAFLLTMLVSSSFGMTDIGAINWERLEEAPLIFDARSPGELRKRRRRG